jgi:hypothetical protein
MEAVAAGIAALLASPGSSICKKVKAMAKDLVD